MKLTFDGKKMADIIAQMLATLADMQVIKVTKKEQTYDESGADRSGDSEVRG